MHNKARGFDFPRLSFFGKKPQKSSQHAPAVAGGVKAKEEK